MGQVTADEAGLVMNSSLRQRHPAFPPLGLPMPFPRSLAALAPPPARGHGSLPFRPGFHSTVFPKGSAGQTLLEEVWNHPLEI